ncbi:MAG: radical SAM protein [Thermoplasmataceae archaeon]
MVSPSFTKNNGLYTVSKDSGFECTFDEAGNLISLTKNGQTFRRSLFGYMITFSQGEGSGNVKRIPDEESRLINAEAYRAVDEISSTVSGGNFSEIIRKIQEKSGQIEADSIRFKSLYSRAPLVPPGLSLPIYVELSYGCDWNRCTICSSHKERHYQEKSPEEFAAHLSAVSDAFGNAISSRDSVFLGDANAMNVDQKKLNEAISAVRNKFGKEIETSFDIFTTPKRKNMIHFQDMKRNGLTRVNVYIQSGSYKVLRILNEHTNATEVLNLVNNMKDSGLGVSLVVLAGTGGSSLSAEHIEGSANLVSQMILDSSDTVYISPIIESEDQSYVEQCERLGIRSMSWEEKELQADEIERRIRDSFRDINGSEFPAKIVKYDLRKNIY